MRHALKLHPDSACAAVNGIEVEVLRPRPGLLSLRYLVAGAIGALRLPARVIPERTDGLWRHSCFEAFVRPVGWVGYCEINLSPSTQWAAYRFDSYRSGVCEAGGIEAPRIETRGDDQAYELRATLALDDLADAAWRVGLSAVIEAADGALSYWALAHPPGKADFHHGDGFAYDLPVAEQS